MHHKLLARPPLLLGGPAPSAIPQVTRDDDGDGGDGDDEDDDGGDDDGDDGDSDDDGCDGGDVSDRGGFRFIGDGHYYDYEGDGDLW